MKSCAVIQARMGSSRLPGKTLTDLAGRPILDWVVRAARNIPGNSAVIVATSDASADDPIVAWCDEHDVQVLRGPLDNVLARFLLAAEAADASAILRITGDCPFLDPWVAGCVLTVLQESGAAIARNNDCGTWPDGTDVEAISVDALRAANEEAMTRPELEHVSPFITKQHSRFPHRSVPCPIPGIGHHRWTIDTVEDLEYLRAIAERLPRKTPPAISDILALLRAEPHLQRAEKPLRNEGYAGLLPSGNAGPPPLDRSQAYFKRALNTVPIGSQTFSKSSLQFPAPRSPLFLTHGLGGRVWDLDGNEYVDMLMSLMALPIGYCDPTINDAIRHQLNSGISFSLPTTLEAELSERLVDLIPSAEAVRFGKNGTDATSAAIRIARAYTGRERVMTCGYHGWQDWYIGATARRKGVPESVSALTHTVPYNDIGTIEGLLASHPGEFAALIMEPVTFDEPKPGYLEAVRALTARHGVVLVFDEIVTGFHFSLGGAQEMFGVTPDLSCFGKGLGNGMPIAAVVGDQSLMRECEDIFFSGTFGGETLSLAACMAVLDLMSREPVIDTLWQTGEVLANGVKARISIAGLHDVLTLKGYAPWTLTACADHPSARKEAIRTVFLREMIAGGVLTLGGHHICYRHSERDIAHVLEVYERALGVVADELATGDLESRLDVPVIEPIFQVRGAPNLKLRPMASGSPAK